MKLQDENHILGIIADAHFTTEFEKKSAPLQKELALLKEQVASERFAYERGQIQNKIDAKEDEINSLRSVIREETKKRPSFLFNFLKNSACLGCNNRKLALNSDGKLPNNQQDMSLLRCDQLGFLKPSDLPTSCTDYISKETMIGNAQRLDDEMDVTKEDYTKMITSPSPTN